MIGLRNAKGQSGCVPSLGKFSNPSCEVHVQQKLMVGHEILNEIFRLMHAYFQIQVHN